MDKIYNTREEQTETNLERSNVSLERVSDNSVIFSEKVRGSRYRPADPRKLWDYLELLFSMLADSFNGKYPVPKKTVFVITFALLYLISPIDISPDILPLIGFVDDIAVLVFAASLIKDDLEKYYSWKMSY